MLDEENVQQPKKKNENKTTTQNHGVKPGLVNIACMFLTD